MTDEERQLRIWNMNSHFVWALAMWGSGEHARTSGSTLLAAVGHYYAAFHAGFATACTDHTINLKDYERVDHGTIHRWTTRLLGGETGASFDRLRQMREKLNYMGMGEPLNKFLLVQGRIAGVEFDGSEATFEQAIQVASDISREVVMQALSHVEAHCAKHAWPGPKRGDRSWMDDYLQDDILRTVFTDDDSRRRVLALGFALIK
jgi:hypothetical protein